MAYVVIVNVDENNRVSKYQPCETEAEAQAHVDKVNELGYHNAFYVEDPGVDGLPTDATVVTGLLPDLPRAKRGG